MNGRKTAPVLVFGLTALLIGGPSCDRRPDAARVDPPRSPAPTSAPTAAAPRSSAVDPKHDLDLSRIQLPPGFHIRPYATGVKAARSMTLSPSRTLFVGSRKGGRVYAIPNRDGDETGDRVIELTDDLDTPNGVAFRGEALYVAEIHRVLRFDDVEKHLDDEPRPTVVTDRYPKDEHHGWKYIAFGPDGRLYIPIGAPCDTCDEDARGYSNITRIDADGSHFEIVARGVRNTVGFDWHPVTKELWFTENGRDRLGDDVPPDELNRLEKNGTHFGYPYCHAGTLDPEFGKGKDCARFTAPVQKLGAHVAALGMKFYTGEMFPDEYKNQIFIAEHGSWNRSTKSGYRIMLVKLEGNRAVSYEEFATGFVRGDDVSGRPVDVLVMPDGALLISDDDAGAIYRISYEAPKP